MTGNDVSIQPIAQADAAAWRPLWAAYLAFYETTLEDAIYETSFARLTDPRVTDYHGFLARDGDTPVGLVHFIYHRHGWHIEPVCYLQDLFTAPGARGRGVARALIEAVYARADRDGAASVYWLTQEFNTQARALYDKVATVTPFVKYVRPAA